MAGKVLSCEAGAIDRAGEVVFAGLLELDVLQARNNRRSAVGSSGCFLDVGNLSLDLAVVLDGSKMDHFDGVKKWCWCSGNL